MGFTPKREDWNLIDNMTIIAGYQAVGNYDVDTKAGIVIINQVEF